MKTVNVFEQLNDGQVVNVLEIITCKQTCLYCEESTITSKGDKNGCTSVEFSCPINRNINQNTFCKHFKKAKDI